MYIVIEILVLFLKIVFYYFEALYRLVVPHPRKNIQGKIVLVTGAGRGIGRELAFGLAKLGASIALLDIDEASNAETAELIKDASGTAFAYKCDVTNTRNVAEVAEKVRRDVGHVDVLINNAGVLTCKRLLQLQEKDIRRTLEVNTLAPFWTVKEFLPGMVSKNSGHIVVLSSMASKAGVALLTDYCCSKYGSNGFAEALSEELRMLRATGVQVTTVYPMFVDTRLVTDLADRIEYHDRFNKILTPKEVAEAIIDGILRNQRYIYIPWTYAFVEKVIPWLPLKVRPAATAFADAGFFEKKSI